MVPTWKKPKYAPFEEQAEHEQADSAVLVVEPEADPAEELTYPANFGESANSFQIDLLDSWSKP